MVRRWSISSTFGEAAALAFVLRRSRSGQPSQIPTSLTETNSATAVAASRIHAISV